MDNNAAMHLELIFNSGPLFDVNGPKVKSAYIAMGWHTTDEKGRPRLSSVEYSFESLKAQVEYLKLKLDEILICAESRFEGREPQ